MAPDEKTPKSRFTTRNERYILKVLKAKRRDQALEKDVRENEDEEGISKVEMALKVAEFRKHFGKNSIFRFAKNESERKLILDARRRFKKKKKRSTRKEEGNKGEAEPEKWLKVLMQHDGIVCEVNPVSSAHDVSTGLSLD